MNLYVIGPITGIENENRQEFERVAGILGKKHDYISIPHDNYLSVWDEWREAMALSVRHIGNELYEDGDNFGIALLDGWEKSKGATIEHDLAVSLGIPCKPWREWL